MASVRGPRRARLRSRGRTVRISNERDGVRKYSNAARSTFSPTEPTHAQAFANYDKYVCVTITGRTAYSFGDSNHARLIANFSFQRCPSLLLKMITRPLPSIRRFVQRQCVGDKRIHTRFTGVVVVGTSHTVCNGEKSSRRNNRIFFSEIRFEIRTRKKNEQVSPPHDRDVPG